MDLIEARQMLARVDTKIPTRQWDRTLTAAVQRLLGTLHLLNPSDDVDGLMGPRTREGWRFFKEAAGLDGADSVAPDSARVLIHAADDPVTFLGRVTVELPTDFAFRRAQRDTNRATSISALVDAGNARGLTKPQIAYVLATADHESDSFGTLEEYASGDRYEGRGDLGNSEPGDGRRYKGRGYVQLTGRRNYASYAAITGLSLTKLPVLLMNWPALSVFVIFDGMTRGAYTGRRLDEFVNGTRQDFFNARQVVNGHDRADKIAAQAVSFMRQVL
jgi:predicted chitinase